MCIYILVQSSSWLDQSVYYLRSFYKCLCILCISLWLKRIHTGSWDCNFCGQDSHSLAINARCLCWFLGTKHAWSQIYYFSRPYSKFNVVSNYIRQWNTLTFFSRSDHTSKTKLKIGFIYTNDSLHWCGRNNRFIDSSAFWSKRSRF